MLGLVPLLFPFVLLFDALVGLLGTAVGTIVAARLAFWAIRQLFRWGTNVDGGTSQPQVKEIHHYHGQGPS